MIVYERHERVALSVQNRPRRRYRGSRDHRTVTVCKPSAIAGSRQARFPASPSWPPQRVRRPSPRQREHRPGLANDAQQAALLAGFLVRSTRCHMRPGRAERGILCTFLGHVRWFCLLFPRSWGAVTSPPVWVEAGGGLGEPRTGACFPGPGGFWVSPQSIPDWSPLLHVLRSGVGVILTSPSLLVEGVRSGSRRRNAATASPLAGEGIRLGGGDQQQSGRAG